MKKIVALGGSNSKNSINKELASYVANQMENVEVTILDLNDFNLPLYGIDLENDEGIPEDAKRLNKLLESADGLVISLAEHNGAYSAAFKSAYDWLSRIDKNVWKNKPMFLMAASPGGRGGSTVLQIAKAAFPHLGANIVADFSMPSFHSNFKDGSIADKALLDDLIQKLKLFQKAI